jgi:ribosomal-protein-alanine N-acetyltransferase
MTLRPARARDARAMAQVHALAFAAGWSAHELAGFMAGPGAFALVVEGEDALSGFILCRAIAGEAEVLTLAVAPAQRRAGVARALLKAAMDAAIGVSAEAMFLEVAADNAAAIGLYEGAGFQSAGLRRGYYSQGGVAKDALVMRHSLNS